VLFRDLREEQGAPGAGAEPRAAGGGISRSGAERGVVQAAAAA